MSHMSSAHEDAGGHARTCLHALPFCGLLQPVDAPLESASLLLEAAGPALQLLSGRQRTRAILQTWMTTTEQHVSQQSAQPDVKAVRSLIGVGSAFFFRLDTSFVYKMMM